MPKELLDSVGGIKKLRKCCFDAVVRWEWYQGHLARDPIPYRSEAAGLGTPKRLAKEPNDKKTAAKVGIDAAGRTVVRQTYFVHQGEPYPHDLLFYYEPQRVVTVRLETTIAGEPQRLAWVEELKLLDGRVVASGSTTYHYDKTGLLESSEHQHGATTYDYDELGQLIAIDFGSEKRFRRKPKGVTMASTMKRIEELLLEEIPQLLASRAPEEEVYCFALVHSLGVSVLPPLLGLGLTRERARLLAEPDPERAFWDPIEWELFEDERFALVSPELLVACGRAQQLCVEAGSTEPVRKMLWKVLTGLGERLPKLLHTSDDFVAVALHAEHKGLDKDLQRLKKSLPAATKASLAAVLP